LVVMMMDPAGSLEVTIDSLLSAIASASLAVTNFIRSVRSARTDLVQVTRELSDLRLELELLRDEHNVPRRPQSHARALLDSCGVVLRRIGSLLGDSLSKADAGRPPRWSVKERFETTNLCNCLQVYREALTILLEMANLYVDPRPFLPFVRFPCPVTICVSVHLPLCGFFAVGQCPTSTLKRLVDLYWAEHVLTNTLEKIVKGRGST
jgi:hypothetical protein